MKRFYMFVLIIILGFSCQPEAVDINNTSVDDDRTVDSAVPVIEPTGDEKYLNNDSEYIFDQDKLHTFELNLPNASLAELDNDPTAENYLEGSLTFEGETLSPVGIRYKGSIGAFVNCVSGRDWTNPSGHKTCTKLSMKVKINWLDSSDKFYKLKKLQFHSQNHDDSQMRERLGYWLYRQMGVPAPRSVHARLLINGKFSGVYALTEQIDGRFTKYNFEDGDGNLYKELWPIDANGKTHATATYQKALETNEEDGMVELFERFGQDISASNTSNIKEVISNWMNIDEIMSYVVVDRTIRNDDGAFHWYCGSGNCSNHNYYWYVDPVEQRAHLIPWDLDNAFENINFDRNPVTPIADKWGEITNDCKVFRYGSLFVPQRSAACDKLTAGWVQLKDEYERKMNDFKNGPFTELKTDELINQWSAQIRKATEEADSIHDDAISIGEWESAMSSLIRDLQIARN